MKFAALLIASVLLSVPGGDQAVKPEVNPRHSPATAIRDALNLLEAKEYRVFLERYMPPDALKQMTQRMSMEDFVKGFSERNVPRLLPALRDAVNEKPQLNEKKDVATFLLTKPIGQKDKIVFEKIGEYWFFRP